MIETRIDRVLSADELAPVARLDQLSTTQLAMAREIASHNRILSFIYVHAIVDETFGAVKDFISKLAP